MRYAVRAGQATRTLVLALWLVATGACAGLPKAGDRSAACWPHFPYASGWLGGDGAYSIPLSPTRTLWLFGDTFIGADGQADRAGAIEQLVTREGDLHAYAVRRAEALLADHRRVREASDARGRYGVKALVPPDVIGLYVLLPKVD